MFQLQVLTAQGSWINYGRPKTVEQCDATRSIKRDLIEGRHFRFEPV